MDKKEIQKAVEVYLYSPDPTLGFHYEVSATAKRASFSNNLLVTSNPDIINYALTQLQHHGVRQITEEEAMELNVLPLPPQHPDEGKIFDASGKEVKD